MRKLLILSAVGVIFSGLGLLKAADSGEKITITGDGLCAKCALKEEPKCQNVVIVTKDGKETKYYLEKNDVANKAHSKMGFCQATKDDPAKVKVTGTCEKKDEKLVLTAEKIEKAE
jgi:Family of unknown function (DUF6370)